MIRCNVGSIRPCSVRQRPAARGGDDDGTNCGGRVRVFHRVRGARARPQVFYVVSNNRLAFHFKGIRQAAIAFNISNGRVSGRNGRHKGISFRSGPTVDLSLCGFKRLRNSRGRCRDRSARACKGLVASGLYAASRHAGRQRFVVATPTYGRGASGSSAKDYRRRRCTCIRIRGLHAFVGEGADRDGRQDSGRRGQDRVMRRVINTLQRRSFLDRRFGRITSRLSEAPFASAIQARATLRRSTSFTLRMGRCSDRCNVWYGSTRASDRAFCGCNCSFQRGKRGRLVCPIYCCAGIRRVVWGA